MSARACSSLVNLATNMKNHEEMIAKGAPEAITSFLTHDNLSKAVKLKAVFALAMLVGKVLSSNFVLKTKLNVLRIL